MVFTFGTENVTRIERDFRHIGCGSTPPSCPIGPLINEGTEGVNKVCNSRPPPTPCRWRKDWRAKDRHSTFSNAKMRRRQAAKLSFLGDLRLGAFALKAWRHPACLAGVHPPPVSYILPLPIQEGH